MKIVKQGYEILSEISDGGIKELQHIEKAGRVCYKSENRITTDGESAKDFVKRLIRNGHEAILEHSSLSVKFICDRGISHELVRHRLCAFAQESTRYCNYTTDRFDSEITVIAPEWYDNDDVESQTMKAAFESLCRASNGGYALGVCEGFSVQDLRCMLPMALKTELVVTANYREWRHIFKLRTAKAAHPQIRRLLIPLLNDLKTKIPAIFDDIIVEEG